jgi:serine O-acetyltransferase
MSAILLYRTSRWLHERRVPWLPRLVYGLNRVVFGVVLPPQAKIGRNVTLGYQGLGVVVHAEAEIGDGVVLGPGVTIGGRGEPRGVPRVEADVTIGTGAKILGPIRIGRGARIGANAVVLCDVPSQATAVGVPARIIVRDDTEPGSVAHR